jgi:hypothetical protein
MIKTAVASHPVETASGEARIFHNAGGRRPARPGRGEPGRGAGGAGAFERGQNLTIGLAHRRARPCEPEGEAPRVHQ